MNMFTTLLTLMSTTLNMLLLTTMHPLSITLLIIMQTIIICMLMGPASSSLWFSYILFLIFLGGMIVLFIYMTSLASNEMLLFPQKTFIISIIINLTLLPIMFYNNHFLANNPLTKLETMNKMALSPFSELPSNLNQLYNSPTMLLTMTSISYLLITLIIIVKITQIQDGPLRQNS